MPSESTAVPETLLGPVELAAIAHGGHCVARVDGRVIFLRSTEIEWLEAEGNYVKLHVAGVAHLFRETLSALEADLPPDQFLRISRSVIVNLDSVRELQPLFYGDYAVLLRDGTKLTLSRTYRDRLEKLLERRGG